MSEPDIAVPEITLSALINLINEQNQKIDRLYEAVKQHNEWMVWGKDEIEKALKALGPVLSMAAPMVAQMTGGQAPAAAPGGPVFVPPTSTPSTDGGVTGG